jgi:hypothetical protein
MTKFIRVSGIAAALFLTAAAFMPVKATAAANGQSCGGFTGAVCDKGLWCDPLPGLCAPIIGTCRKIPALCAFSKHSLAEVCGCNGKTYWNDCARLKAGEPKRHEGKC